MSAIGTPVAGTVGRYLGQPSPTPLMLNAVTVNNSYTLPPGANAFAVGPITVASGVAVTVPSGQRWVVL